MKAYKTYQEAKIANQDRDIFSLQGKYTCGGDEPLHPDLQGCYWTHCEPSDYLMSVDMFINSGYKICAGDTFIDTDGKVETMTEIDALNNCINDDDNKRYILKSAWIKDKIPTESPQEREALDMIDTTSKQVESLAKGDAVEWLDKDELPPIGCKVMTSFTEPDCDNWCDFHGPSEIIAYHNDYVWVAHHGKFNRIHALSDIEFEKPESPEQKAEKIRQEFIQAIWQDMTDSTKDPDRIDKMSDSYLMATRLFDKGYRQEVL